MLSNGCVKMEEKAVLVLANANVSASPFSLYVHSAKVTIYPFYPQDQPGRMRILPPDRDLAAILCG